MTSEIATAADLGLSGERKKIYDQMPEETKRIVAAIQERHGKLEAAAYRTIWETGASVNRLRRDPEKYGPKADEHVAYIVNISRSDNMQKESQYFDRLARIATTYPDKEAFLALTSRGEKAGYAFSVGTLYTLATVATDTTRRQLESMAIKEKMSVAQLQQEVRLRVSPRPGGGRPVISPRNPQAAAQQVESTCRALQKKLNVWDDALFQQLSDLDAESITPDFAVQIQETVQEMKTVDVQLQQGLQVCNQFLSRVNVKGGSNGKASKPAATKKASPAKAKVGQKTRTKSKTTKKTKRRQTASA